MHRAMFYIQNVLHSAVSPVGCRKSSARHLAGRMDRHAVPDEAPGKAGQGQRSGEEVGRPEGIRRPRSIPVTLSTWRFMEGYKSPSMGHNYRCPTYNPT